MKNNYVMFSVALGALAVAIIGVLFQQTQLQKEIAIREKMDRLVLAREPEVQTLPPIIREGKTSSWVIIPIQNISVSSSAGAHRVQASFTFGEDNLIKEVSADPFRVVGGGEGSHSATLELSVLYPRSVIYATFLVEKKEVPTIVIGWAEKTGWQNIPLKD